MRMTYSDLKSQFLRDSGNPGATDTNLIAHFDQNLNERYQLILAQLQNWTTQKTQTATSVSAQQYYHYPVGLVNIETVTITIGTVKYTLTAVDSQASWDRLNAITFSGSAIPTLFFPRRDDFGIWPIPQGAYTITFNYDLRDRNLTTADYITGTVTATNNSQTLTGSGTTWTAGMVGRWFKATTDGYWYRVSAFTSTTSLTLETSFEGTTGSSLAYTIGESPELPEEAHPMLVTGCISDYYAGPRSDIAKATWFNNVFWTGDGNNNDRTGRNIRGGLIGLGKRYASRSNSKMVYRRPYRNLTNTKLFATVLS